ncbi:putative autotransporter protein [Kaumoebavirus]|uniref:putative autotransporter protein n=1 Tax=Kaumoebavirus TaxID=1859492 RepID=UPI0009C22AB0|nr:putative autotransporter protein [Kaumoebavirus]ARA72239.1 putative autotransporter protein [Kaumoebavirus]
MSSFVGSNGVTFVGSQANLTTGAATTLVLTSAVAADAQKRYQVAANGTQSWGSGSATQDVFLYRSAANTLAIGTTTSDAVGVVNATLMTTQIQGTSAGGAIALANEANLTFNRASAAQVIGVSNAGAAQTWQLLSSGAQGWSDGSAAYDAYLYRSAANTLTLGSTASNTSGTLIAGTFRAATAFRTFHTTSTNTMLQNNNSANSFDPTFVIDADGQHGWATFSTNGARDTWIWRSAASTLTLSANSRGTNAATLRLATLTSPTGNLSISSAGTDIGFNAKNLTGVGSIAIAGAITTTLSAATGSALVTQITGDTQARFNLTAGGEQAWGAGTSSARDVFLYRSAANTLALGTSGSNTSGTLSLATLIAGTAINTPSITTAGSGISFNTKNITGVAALSATSADFAASVSGTVVLSAKPSGGANNNIALVNTGELQWGSGSAVADAFLYRSAANTLTLSTTSTGTANGTLALGTVTTNTVSTAGGSNLVLSPSGGNVDFSGANIINANLAIQPNFPISGTVSSSTSSIIQVNVTGDTQFRYYVEGSGQTSWGPGGTTARDVYLSRTDVNTLSIGTSSGAENGTLRAGNVRAGGFYTTNSSGSFVTFSTKIAGETFDRLFILSDGSLMFSPGSGDFDTLLKRSQAGRIAIRDLDDTVYAELIGSTLYGDTQISTPKITSPTTQISFDLKNVFALGITEVNGYVRATQTTTSGICFQADVSGESSARFYIRGGGEHVWGAGDGITPTTYLYRSAEGVLTFSTSSGGNGNAVMNTGVYAIDGRYALLSPGTASSQRNAYVGVYRSDLVMTSGAFNAAIGADAGKGMTTGSYNVCLGSTAGQNITTGSYNICSGFASAFSMYGSSNNIIIGKNTDINDSFGASPINDCIVIGTGATASASNATAIGFGASNAAANTSVFGSSSNTNNTFYGSMTTFGVPTGSTASYYETNTSVGGGNPRTYMVQGKVLTTDATTTTIYTVPISTSTTVMLRADITARRTGGAAATGSNGAAYEIVGAYENTSGTVSLIGGFSPSITSFVNATDGWTATFTISSTNVLVRVTGKASTNISWHLAMWVTTALA